MVVLILRSYSILSVRQAFLFSPSRSCKMARSVADCSITVVSLECAIHEGLSKYPSKDLDETLKLFGDQTLWNSGPKANFLAVAAPMLFPIIQVCRNGVVPSKKFETALLSQNCHTKLNFTKDTNIEFANTRGTPHDSYTNVFIKLHIRMSLSHSFRFAYTCVYMPFELHTPVSHNPGLYALLHLIMMCIVCYARQQDQGSRCEDQRDSTLGGERHELLAVWICQ
jgi:hypothetical protein